MNVISQKPGRRPHRTWCHVLPTPEPWAFCVPAGSPVREADGTEWSSPYPVILQFWPQRYYQVCYLFKPSGPAYYCNVIAPPVYHPQEQALIFTDLELDVIVDGTQIKLADEDEFAEAPISADVRREAEQAARHLQALANIKSGPFSQETAAFWFQWLQSR